MPQPRSSSAPAAGALIVDDFTFANVRIYVKSCSKESVAKLLESVQVFALGMEGQ
jgi:hypothetical protein